MAKIQRPKPTGYFKLDTYGVRLTKAGMSPAGAKQVLSGQMVTSAKDRQIVAAAISSLVGDEIGIPKKGFSFGVEREMK